MATEIETMTPEQCVLEAAGMEITCPECIGKGKTGYQSTQSPPHDIYTAACSSCQGEGTIPRFKELRRDCPDCHHGLCGNGHYPDVGVPGQPYWDCRKCGVPLNADLPGRCVNCQGKGWRYLPLLEACDVMRRNEGFFHWVEARSYGVAELIDQHFNKPDVRWAINVLRNPDQLTRNFLRYARETA